MACRDKKNTAIKKHENEKKTILCSFKIIKCHIQFDFKTLSRADLRRSRLRLDYIFRCSTKYHFLFNSKYQVELSFARFSKYSTDLNLLVNDQII